MAKRKPVDLDAVDASLSAVAGLAERIGVDENTRSDEPTTRGTGLFSQSVVTDPAYAAPALGVRLKSSDAQSARWEGYSAWDYVKDLAANETLTVGAAIALRESGYEYDANYALPDLKSTEWKQLTDGIDPEKWHALGNAVSADHAREIAFRLREEVDREQRLMEGGVLPFLVGNILNPESVLMAIGSGGITWVQKGSRLTRAMKMAGVATAENVAQEGALNLLQDNRDSTDLAFAAAAGMTLGFAFGGLGKGLPDDVRADAARAARRDADRVASTQAHELGLVPKPAARSAAQDAFDSEVRLIEGDIARTLDAEEARLQKLAAGPDSLHFNEFARRLEETKRMRDDIARELAEDEAKQIDVEAQRLARSDEKNDYAIKRAREAGSADDVVFAQWTQAATTNVKARRARAADTQTKAQKLIDTLQLEVDRVNTKRAAETDLEQIRNSRTAKTVDERIEALPKGLREVTARRLTTAHAELAEGLKLEASQPATTVSPAGEPELKFGEDSASAASLADAGVERSIFGPSTSETAPSRLLRWFPRFDYAARLRSVKLLKDAAMRGRTEGYVGDPMPEKGAVSKIGASEEAARLRERHATQFYQVYDEAFKAFVEEQGKGRLSRVSRRTRREFGRAVTLALRGVDTTNVHAKKAAARLAEIFGEMGEDLKAAGVKGFEEFVRDARYFPRVPDRVKALQSRDTYGEPRIVEAVEASMKKAYDDEGFPLDAAVLKRMAQGYYARIHDLSLGIENEALTGLRLADADHVAGLMRLGGADEEMIADVVGRLRNALANPEGGTARFAKKRTLLNEDHEVKLFNKESGRWENKTLRDLLFHDDAEQVFQTYNHVMSGWTSLAKQAGVKSRVDHDKLVDALKRELPVKDGENVANALNDAYKFIVGQPLFDTKRGKTLRRMGRALRDYQFARVMNMVGFAQIPDSAAFLAPHYFRFIARHLPEVGSMFRRMQDGKLEHQLARDLEEWVGGGTDMLHNKLFSAYDDEPDAPLSKVEHALRVAGRITERNPLGVSPLTTLNQRLAEIAISQRFTDTILGKAKGIDLDRWQQLGLDADMLKRIKAQVEKHVEFDGNKLRALDLAKWDDHVAREKFVQAIHRESKRAVQEEDFGDTYPFMHSALGKLLIQFRRFGIVSYVKQLGNAVANPSWETSMRLVTQWSLGSMSYATQMYLYSLTKPEEERQEWRDKYMTPTRIFFAGIARAGMFSLTPALMESVWQTATGAEGVFSNTRTTGLGASLIAGVPALDFMSRAIEFTSDVSQSLLRQDRQFDRKDFENFRKILLFQNMIGIKQALDLIGNSLPEGDEDDDTKIARFVGGVEISKDE